MSSDSVQFSIHIGYTHTFALSAADRNNNNNNIARFLCEKRRKIEGKVELFQQAVALATARGIFCQRIFLVKSLLQEVLHCLVWFCASCERLKNYKKE
jgi:hypothetical protein